MTTLINILTLSRILLAAIIFVLLMSPDGYLLALVLFFLAGVTDYFDGYLARKYNAVSQLGEILDPIADKILILFVLFGLAINLSSYLIGFIGAIIITREIWVGALRDLNARNGKSDATKVTFLAKIKTSVQLFTLSIYLFGLAINNMLIIFIADILLFISLFITLYTGFIYTFGTFKKMKNLNKEDYKICIVGLGYVGLPLAARFSLKGFDVTGFDIKEERINQLVNKIDINNDISNTNLEILVKNSELTSNIDEIKGSNIFIITVPTPINEDKTPDLSPLEASSRLVGRVMQKDSIVIYESTVYPGVTDEVCTPILEEKSGLIFNKEFSTGYSPERIVPGDKINTIETITKVVSGSNRDALEIISFLYSSIIDSGVHQAPSIKVAEAAKVTENIQRDVNIALINEMHQLYSSIGINTNDVIEAAATKWNFMKLTPGMVGGHCISIDPYYLMHKSEMSGYVPNIMRASRKINDEMSKWVVERFLEFAEKKNINIHNTEITFLGYSFKENCSDVRNTKVKDLINLIKDLGVSVSLWDPVVDKNQLLELESQGVKILYTRPNKIKFAFLCVNHNEINRFLESYTGLVFDYKNIDFN